MDLMFLQLTFRTLICKHQVLARITSYVALSLDWRTLDVLLLFIVHYRAEKLLGVTLGTICVLA